MHRTKETIMCLAIPMFVSIMSLYDLIHQMVSFVVASSK